MFIHGKYVGQLLTIRVQISILNNLQHSLDTINRYSRWLTVNWLEQTIQPIGYMSIADIQSSHREHFQLQQDLNKQFKQDDLASLFNHLHILNSVLTQLQITLIVEL